MTDFVVEFSNDFNMMRREELGDDKSFFEASKVNAQGIKFSET